MSIDNEENEIFDTGAYQAPAASKAVIDTTKNEVRNLRELTPFEQFEVASKEHNIPVQKPKKNCKKCYERGYIGFETGTKVPIPCDCIFPKKTLEEQRKEREKGLPINFYPAKVRRQFKLDNRKMIKKRLKQTGALDKVKEEIVAELESLKNPTEQIENTITEIERDDNV